VCAAINDCVGNPCQNGGACVDGVNAYTCTCAAGYTGTNCETNINDCAPDPCQNGAACVDGVNDYSCTCPAGYSGKTCATNIDDCAANPCLNGGACVDGVNAFTCTCAAGYSGSTCSVLTPTFLWLDSTDAATITKDNANKVTEWRDKSGLGRHATLPASFSSTSPVWTDAVVNGLPAISFNGNQVRLRTAPVASAAEMTIFVVYNMVAPQTWGTIINQAHDTFFSIRQSAASGNINFHIQNNNNAPLLPIATNTWRLLTSMRQGTTSTMYHSAASPVSFVGDTLTGGVVNASCDTASGTCITLGNAIDGRQESMGGYLAEVRAYTSALDAPTRTSIETALKTKYAIP
jgi:hypothetical protein